MEIVTIGDELLLGFTIDTNAAHIAKALAPAGVSITRRATVGDREDDIVSAIRDAMSRADGVITTGGLGPTSDDRSRSAIATVFNTKLALHEPTLDGIKARWAKRGLGELPATNRQQAMLPEGATLLANRHGSAPGIWMDDASGKWVAMLPGVPREMRGLLADELLPRVLERAGAGGMVVASRTLRTTGVAESWLADQISALRLPEEVELAYLPSWEGVDLRLTVRDLPAQAAADVLLRAAQTLRAPIAHTIYGEDGADLAALMLDRLREQKSTIAVAESCTGGMLGARLTAAPGSSDVVRGGIIAYHDDIKRDLLSVPSAVLSAHGAVSEETVRAMATGVRTATGATIGVGISGIAGPGGGSPEKPVGTVCIAVDADGRTLSRRLLLIGDRDEVRRRATQAALIMVRDLVTTP